MTPDDVKAAPDGLADFANDTWKLPIAGVKVFVLGHEDEPVFTDAQGRFTLSNVPTGDVKIEFDGTAATNAPSGFYFPVMVMDTTIRPGIANTIMGSMGSPDVQAANTNNPAVYLPRLATNILTTVSDTAPTVVTAPSDTGTGGTNLTPDQLNQLSLTVQPGSIVDENGNPVQNAQVGISPVPASLVMDMLPPGLMQHTFDITIQVPNGATFTTPAVLTMPNVFGAAPGTKLDILSFDHTTGRLVIDGTGTVSADGQTVVSDPGSGVTAPGWHGMAPPGGSGHGNVGGGHGNNNNKDPCDAANSQFQDLMKDSFFAIADAYGLEAALLGLATGKDLLVKSLGLPPSATDLIKKLNYVALGTDVLALANHINKLDSPAAERDILYIALDVLSFVPELAYPAGGARTAFAVWDLTNDIDTMRADAEKMRQAYEQCLNSSSAMPETAVSATGVVGGIGGLQQSFEDAADRALAEFTLQKPIWLDLSQQWLDVAAILKTIDRDNHIAGGLTATQVQSLVDKLNVMIDEGKTIAARPDLNATINAAISANGMVRPCSCPASDRSWQGAPKTRSTP